MWRLERDSNPSFSSCVFSIYCILINKMRKWAESLGNESTWFLPASARTKLPCLELQFEVDQVVEEVGLLPEVFNSSAVLPPCLRRRSAISFCDPISQLILRRTTFLTIYINILLIYSRPPFDPSDNLQFHNLHKWRFSIFIINSLI